MENDMDFKLFKYLDSQVIHIVDIRMYKKNIENQNKILIINDDFLNKNGYSPNFIFKDDLYNEYPSLILKEKTESFFMNFAKHVISNYKYYLEITQDNDKKIEYNGLIFTMHMTLRTQSLDSLDLSLGNVELSQEYKSLLEKREIMKSLPEEINNIIKKRI